MTDMNALPPESGCDAHADMGTTAPQLAGQGSQQDMPRQPAAPGLSKARIACGILWPVTAVCLGAGGVGELITGNIAGAVVWPAGAVDLVTGAHLGPATTILAGDGRAWMTSMISRAWAEAQGCARRQDESARGTYGKRQDLDVHHRHHSALSQWASEQK